MGFIANTPADLYYLVIPSQDHFVYGCFFEEVTEYLLNEFPVHQFDVIEASEVMKVACASGYRSCGNKELLIS